MTVNLTEKFKDNIVCKGLGITYPIIQGGMIWVSGSKLAATCSESGILGTIGAGSMTPEVLKEHILKAQKLTSKPIAVNIPLLYSRCQEQIEICLEHGVKTIITSAGSPKKFTTLIKNAGPKVLHVTSNPLLAKKCEDAGVDMVIAEGFEAGGHNGRDELTTMVLIPQVRKAVSIPVIAAGGIGSGQSIMAALCLGADGVQIGSLFAAAVESSAHDQFKKKITEAGYDSTRLMLKNLVPVRLLENNFSKKVALLEQNGASEAELKELLGKGRSKLGMFDGNMEEGELEIGQIACSIDRVSRVSEIVGTLLSELGSSLMRL
ncbi:MAG: nitronate monooxygenase [Bacteriovoracaceae bacterium]|jgi:enoyl-[acyl-carrier protein] reductase II|nr:nitronate monooxygenase [Bacteriovoracaceae bacterium]